MHAPRWAVVITFDKLEFTLYESAFDEQSAINSALRYCRAMGYSGQPTTIHSRRIKP